MPTLLRLITRVITRIWNVVSIGLIYIHAIGVVPILALAAGDKKETRASAETMTGNDKNKTKAEYTQARKSGQQWLPIKLLRSNSTLQQLADPKSFWVPLSSITLMVLYVFRLLDQRHVTLAGVNEYQVACPVGNRRTQAGAFAKLLAASVTTVCIHGHLGSLVGSDSWRRQIRRAAEILVSPLASLFTIADAAWYAIASSPAYGNSPWSENIGLRYRLARMCSVCIESDTLGSPVAFKFYLASINSVHVKRVALKRTLKWSGRVLVLVILFAQYVQAAILLTRRLISHTAAALDLAMFLMVLSGLVGLVQSLIISAINTSWTLDPDTEPCVAKACRRPECITFKSQHDVPNSVFKVVVFGYDISGIPRAILHALAGGYLLLTLQLQNRTKFWEVLRELFGLQFVWQKSLTLAIYADLMVKIINGDSKNPLTPDPEAEEKTTSTPTETHTSSPGPLPQSNGVKSSSNRTTYTSRISTALINTGIFMLGLGTIAFVLLALITMFLYLFVPTGLMYTSLVEETSTWREWNASTACPQLWVDGLENKLLSF